MYLRKNEYNKISNEKKKSKVLSVFDFDGTLTNYDSFVSFLYFSFGKRYFSKCLIRMLLLAFYYVCDKLTQCDKLTRDDLKKILIKCFLSDVREEWIRQQAKYFCEQSWVKLMRPSAVEAVVKEINSGAEVTLCSASPTLLLQPFADKLGIKVIGTQLEIKNGKTTGNITGNNCRCEQKVARLKNIYGDLSIYYLRVWGDTRGDHELLAIAQEAYWKHFHDSS